MTEPLCDWLIDFALGELPPDQELEFELHLTGCDHCREALQLDREIDRLLLVAYDSSPVPPVDRLVQLARPAAATVNHPQPVRRGLLSGLWVLVPSLLFATLMWHPPVNLNDSRNPPAEPIVDRSISPENQIATESFDLSQMKQISSVSSETHLPVEIKTENPKVQLVWFYSTGSQSKDHSK